MTGQPTDEAFVTARRRIAQTLRAAGFEEAGLEANRMVAGVTGLDAVSELTSERTNLTAAEATALEAMLARRLAREPLQHILGHTWFYGLEILTDRRALIPRPDSECVVEAALERLPEGRALNLADLGTGTGCLLAALLSQRPMARGVAIEASPEAASLARENFSALGLAARAELFEGSWADWAGWGSVDLVISNPPYIASEVIAGLDPEVRDHDPHAALDGGPDGLAAYRQIIALAAAGLKSGAWLVLESGFDQRAAITGLLASHGFAEIAAGRDLGGNDRWAAGRKAP